MDEGRWETYIRLECGTYALLCTYVPPFQSNYNGVMDFVEICVDMCLYISICICVYVCIYVYVCVCVSLHNVFAC